MKRRWEVCAFIRMITMGKINAAWHGQHPMPAHATARQRAEWHYEHALNCGCRAMTPNIARLLREQGFDIPAPPERVDPKAPGRR